ncbi:MarR family winged helix-turn-helix transcriptional regulator [Jatrophihabitans endophyticus]|uniref:MarR family winged helix-turn-helix transcriptional regulator n=1 Tax=Jatrophihabitans endophyticus TaxID=1206085 RepID=UPI0019F39DA6|nr:MarR family transcriptional regulator [Jatrophihabitans endophyticus]MBE7187765.1 MarR family transcriptional regulator [Jatrophihabitans endophyticus]
MVDRFQDLVMPVLLREARDAYTTAIRRRLADAGHDDMPRAGARVIGRIAHGGATVQEVGGAYGVSRQAASQLVENLVRTGYVERVEDPADRRRSTVTLTDRGADAAEQIHDAIDEVDTRLESLFSAAQLRQARRVLGALAAVRYDEDPTTELA